MKHREILGGVVCVCDEGRAICVAVFNWSLTYYLPG
jgi:hypothetical protein